MPKIEYDRTSYTLDGVTKQFASADISRGNYIGPTTNNGTEPSYRGEVSITVGLELTRDACKVQLVARLRAMADEIEQS